MQNFILSLIFMYITNIGTKQISVKSNNPTFIGACIYNSFGTTDFDSALTYTEMIPIDFSWPFTLHAFCYIRKWFHLDRQFW